MEDNSRGPTGQKPQTQSGNLEPERKITSKSLSKDGLRNLIGGKLGKQIKGETRKPNREVHSRTNRKKSDSEASAEDKLGNLFVDKTWKPNR